ncbi:MAG: SGNH/GDSL hydrolase family protein [Candidatus Moraniibacteriota bacterium]|jgi:lysophospholipase L1-like esterase
MSERICVFGSSIGYGHNDSECGGWCDRLKLYFFSSNKDVSVYNLSISGDMSKDVVDRFDVEYKARRPEVVLIAIGINDSTFDENINRCRISLKDTEKNIKQLVSMTKLGGSKIVLVGLTSVTEKLVMPVSWALNLSYSNENIKKYDSVIKGVAKDNNVPYCYMYDLLQDEDFDDGLHPNTDGHRKMFERIRDFLVENNIV